MKKIIYIVFFLVFLFSSLNLTEDLHSTAIYIVYILLLALFLIIPLLSKEKKFKINMPIFLSLFSFLLFCGLSSLINGDIRLLFSALVIIILYVVSCIFIPMLNIEINPIIFNTFLVSHFLVIVIPLIVNSGVDKIPYNGIFYNTNSFGTIAATVFVVLFSRFLTNLENWIKGDVISSSKYKNIIFLMNILFLIASFYLIIISGSRTSFLAGVISLIVGVMYLVVYLIKYKKIGKVIIRGGILSIVLSFMALLITRFTTIDEAIFNNIINKFISRANEKSGLLSSRDDIWAKTIEEATLFGNGNDYFADMGIGAHNTFMSILGRYGWLVLITFVILIIIIFYFSTKFTMSSTVDKYKYLPLMMLICFSCMSMGEDMIFKVSMIIMFLSFGEVIRKIKY